MKKVSCIFIFSLALLYSVASKDFDGVSCKCYNSDWLNKKANVGISINNNLDSLIETDSQNPDLYLLRGLSNSRFICTGVMHEEAKWTCATDKNCERLSVDEYLDNLAKAEKDFNKALQLGLSPNKRSFLHEFKARILNTREQYDDALKDIDNSLVFAKNSEDKIRLHGLKAGCQKEVGDFEGALKSLDYILANQDRNSLDGSEGWMKNHREKGKIYHMIGRYEDALNAYFTAFNYNANEIGIFSKKILEGISETYKAMGSKNDAWYFNYYSTAFFSPNMKFTPGFRETVVKGAQKRANAFKRSYYN